MILAHEHEIKPARTEPLAIVDGVEFWENPWVGGKASRAFFGPVAHETIFVGPGPEWAKAIDDALSDLAAKARELGANTVLGLEMSLIVHGPEKRINAVGTAALMEEFK